MHIAHKKYDQHPPHGVRNVPILIELLLLLGLLGGGGAGRGQLAHGDADTPALAERDTHRRHHEPRGLQILLWCVVNIFTVFMFNYRIDLCRAPGFSHILLTANILTKLLYSAAVCPTDN